MARTMDKDAYYFPHFSNARHDRKLRRVVKQLGVEGYGIYFMILEVLRDQDGFRYPIEDIDLLADEFNTSEQKVKTVIMNYKLFDFDDHENFFSVKFNEYLNPYLENKERSRINGIKGNLIRYNYITKEEATTLTADEILDIDEKRKAFKIHNNIPVESGGESSSDRNESKVDESRVEQSKVYSSELLEAKNPYPPIEKTVGYGISEYLWLKIQSNNPKAKEPNLKKWAIAADRMHRIDGRSKEDIKAVIDWCQDDVFWSTNILSTDKLRKQFDQLYSKMNKKNGGGTNGKKQYNSFDDLPNHVKAYLAEGDNNE